jgi:uncharacterized protein YcfJ
MAVSIEDILLARAAQDEANRPSQDAAITTGAILGSLGGVALGQGLHTGSELIGSAKRLVTRAGDKPMMSRVKPGYRMAGGLVGAILGGALGAGARQLMIQESPAARLLARAQVNGEMTAADEKMLEDILADTYSNTLGM